jgi:hypothetical protein
MFPSSEPGSVFPTQELGSIVWYELQAADLVVLGYDVTPIGDEGELPWGFKPAPFHQERISNLEANIEKQRSMDDVDWGQLFLTPPVNSIRMNSANYYLDALKGNRSLIVEWQPSESEHIDFRRLILDSIDARISQNLLDQERWLSMFVDPSSISEEELKSRKAVHIEKLVKALRSHKSKLKRAKRQADKMTQLVQSLRLSLGLPLEP